MSSRSAIFASAAGLLGVLAIILIFAIVGLVGSKDSSIVGEQADVALADSLAASGMHKAGELYWKWPDQQHSCSPGVGCYFLTIESAGPVCAKGITVRLTTWDRSKNGPRVPLEWSDSTPLTVAQPRLVEIPARPEPPNQTGEVTQLVCNR